MYNSKRNANYIVQEISKIIGEKINMMNEEGIIIYNAIHFYQDIRDKNII